MHLTHQRSFSTSIHEYVQLRDRLVHLYTGAKCTQKIPRNFRIPVKEKPGIYVYLYIYIYIYICFVSKYLANMKPIATNDISLKRYCPRRSHRMYFIEPFHLDHLISLKQNLPYILRKKNFHCIDKIFGAKKSPKNGHHKSKLKNKQIKRIIQQ